LCAVFARRMPRHVHTQMVAVFANPRLHKFPPAMDRRRNGRFPQAVYRHADSGCLRTLRDVRQVGGILICILGLPAQCRFHLWGKAFHGAPSSRNVRIFTVVVALLSAAVGCCLARAQAGHWTLDTVLRQLDSESRTFRSLTADIERTKVTVVVDDKSTESGQIFVRRDDKMRIDFTKPDPRTILRTGNDLFSTTPRPIKWSNTIWANTVRSWTNSCFWVLAHLAPTWKRAT